MIRRLRPLGPLHTSLLHGTPPVEEEPAPPVGPAEFRQLLRGAKANGVLMPTPSQPNPAEEPVSAIRERLERQARRDRERDRAELAAHLLPALDDLARAADYAEGLADGAYKDLDTVLRGVFVQLVKGLGLVPFGLPGERFDPLIHEALDTVPGHPEGMIVQALTPGYRTGAGALVRPARVTVGAGLP